MGVGPKTMHAFHPILLLEACHTYALTCLHCMLAIFFMTCQSLKTYVLRHKETSF